MPLVFPWRKVWFVDKLTSMDKISNIYTSSPVGFSLKIL